MGKDKLPMKTCVLAALLAISSAKYSYATEFTATGYTVVKTDVAIQSDLFEDHFGGHRLQWKNSSKTGTLTAFAAIPINVTSPSHLELGFVNEPTCYAVIPFGYYCDDDRVKVQYIKMNKTSGALTVIKTVDSTLGVNAGASEIVSGTFSDTYDISTYTYYVRIDMNRVAGYNEQVFEYVSVY